MTARNGRSVWQGWYVFGLWCLVALAAPAAVRGDGSIKFNGANTAANATSKLENTGANILDGSNTVTMTAWIKPAGIGEGSYGTIVRVDETGQLFLTHNSSANSCIFTAAWNGGAVLANWSFNVTDGQWSCVQVTYDKSSSLNDPEIYVNGVQQNEVEGLPAPSGSSPNVGSGYCVGNNSNQGFTWDGHIAHVQIHNRILSPTELEACRVSPGSVTNGLRLWIPMTNAGDTEDQSGNGFDGTATALAAGNSGPPIMTNPHGAPEGIAQLNRGILPVTQHVLKRYADGSSHPAGELRGVGTGSAVQGTVHGPSNGSDPQEIVKTEDFGLTMNQWTMNNPDNAIKAVLQPVVRDLTIIGHDDADDDYDDTANTVVPNQSQNRPFFPFGDAIEFNGTTSTGTSMLYNGSANVLSGQKLVTVCCWIHPDGVGEGSDGYLFVLDDADGNGSFIIKHAAVADLLAIIKKNGSGGSSSWAIPIDDGVWNGVCVRLDFTGDNSPTARVNNLKVAATPVFSVSGLNVVPADGYSVGNRNVSSGDRTWDGRIAHVQVFNDILTDQEADDALAEPGSVTSNLRLHLPMTNASDTQDATANNFDGTPTALSDGQNYHDRETGLAIQASGPRVEDVGFFHIAGTSLVLQRGSGSLNGEILPFDREYATLRDVTVYRAYRGFLINTIDTEVGNIEGQYLRDWGVKVPTGIGGVKFEGAVHVSGVVSGVAPAAYGTAVWFAENAGACWGTGPWYCENSDVGMRIDSSGNKITNFYSKVCTYRNLWFDWNAQRNSVENFEIEVDNDITEVYGGEAVLIRSQANTLANGTIGGGELGAIPAGEIAIRFRNGTRQVIRDVTFVGTASSSAPLITIDGGRTVTLDDSTIVAKCYDAGTFVELFPVYTSGTARGGDADEIQLATSTGIPDDDLVGMAVFITSGTGSNQSSTITDYIASTHTATVSPVWSTHPDDDSVYEVRTNRLGTGNHIALTTAGTVTTALNLDSRGWDDWNNTIIVDGVRKVSPAVELTINSGGAITASQQNHVVDTFDDTTPDDLTTINGGAYGRTIVLRAAHTNRTVVVTDGSNLKLNGNFSLDNTEDTITLFHDGTNWVEKSRSDNGG